MFNMIVIVLIVDLSSFFVNKKLPRKLIDIYDICKTNIIT